VVNSHYVEVYVNLQIEQTAKDTKADGFSGGTGVVVFDRSHILHPFDRTPVGTKILMNRNKHPCVRDTQKTAHFGV